jgi:DNA-damage-inducible protein J
MQGGVLMAQATFSVRMDEALKRQFDALCADFGMNATTAFNIFARAVVREKRIPFEIQASETVSRAAGMQAFQALRAEAKKNGVQDLSLDEINEEIREARYGGDKD